MTEKVSDIERENILASLCTSIMEVARERNIPFEAIRRLTTPAGRAALVDMLDIAHTDYLDDQVNPESAEVTASSFSSSVVHEAVRKLR